MGAVVVVGVGEFVEERLELVEVVGAGLGFEVFLEGLLETFDCHVFVHSKACVDALNDVVQSGVSGIDPIDSIKTQVIGADGTRHDLVGFN